MFMPMTKHQTRSPFNFRLIKLFFPLFPISWCSHSFRLSFQTLFRFYGSSINGKLKKFRYKHKFATAFQKFRISTNISNWEQRRRFVYIKYLFSMRIVDPLSVSFYYVPWNQKKEWTKMKKKTLVENEFAIWKCAQSGWWVTVSHQMGWWE